MWGTSFSDLAKRAQEASELAAKKAQEASFAMQSSQLSESAGISSFFNLDNMLEHAGKSQDGGENTNTAEDDYNNHMDDHGDGWFHDDDDVDVDDLLVDKENESLGNTGITANNYIPTEATEEMISKNDQKDDADDDDCKNQHDRNNKMFEHDQQSSSSSSSQLATPLPSISATTTATTTAATTTTTDNEEMDESSNNHNSNQTTNNNETFIDPFSDVDQLQQQQQLQNEEKVDLVKQDNIVEEYKEGNENNDNVYEEEEEEDEIDDDEKKEKEEKKGVLHIDNQEDNNEVQEYISSTPVIVDQNEKEEEEEDIEQHEEKTEQSYENLESIENDDNIESPVEKTTMTVESASFCISSNSNQTSNDTNEIENNNIIDKEITKDEISTIESNQEQYKIQESSSVASNNETAISGSILTSSPARSDGSISPARVNFMSPLSTKDEAAMKISMTNSAEKCDSEKDFSIDYSVDYDDDYDDDEINGMYDDDDDKDEEDQEEVEVAQNGNQHVNNNCSDPIVKQLDQSLILETSPPTNSIEETANKTYSSTTTSTTDNNPIGHVPQFAIEKFMSQLERLHEQHEGELQEMERKHQIHLNEMKEKLESATQQQQQYHQEQCNTKKDVIDSDKYLAQMRDLEKELNDKLKKKDEQISGLVDINKLMEEQIDDLKSEAEGLNASLSARNEMLSKMKEKEDELQKLKDTLKKTESDLESSNEAFTTLKGRVKVVATELKERRVECRTLNLSVQELTLAKSTLESENKDLATKLSTFEQISEVRGKEIENLQNAVTDLRQQVKSKEKELVDKGSVGDKALNTYKKKAQSLLAAANARAAAANQARDDAENDATNARAEAENAVKIAREAEEERHEVVQKSLKEVQKLQNEVDKLKSEKESLALDLESAQTECLKAFEDVKESQVGRDGLLDELNAKDEELEKEIEKKSGLEQDLAMARIKTNDLEDQVSALKLELERASSAAFMARQKETEANSSYSIKTETKQANDQTDATIVMLQQELAVANDVIKDLKESLGAILSQDPTTVDSRELIQKVNSFGSEHASTSTDENGTDSTPLFFALEKQAELKTCRDEITRLAALLGDAESEKMEAYEAKEDMRKRMEEAEARLRRFEKLGSSGGSRTINGSSYSATNGRRGIGAGLYSSSTQVSSISSPNDSSVNLEYLKNIMLRYMNAMSLNEKKALIPVIGAVLELTPDEQMQAMKNIDKNSGIQGVGTTLIENVQSKGIVGGLFGDML